MPHISSQDLSGVAATLLIPLYVRAMESRRPDALISDDRAIALIEQMDLDPSWLAQMRLDEEDRVGLVLRNREFDRRAQGFLARHPQAVVVHIGCGLDSRFERVDNGQAEWYDLDLPEVMALRRKLIGGDGGRYHHLGCSVLDGAWPDRVRSHGRRPWLFLAEGVLMYFEEAQVRALVLRWRDQFPGAELVCDAFSPYLVWLSNLRMRRTGIGAHYYWGLKRGRDVEQWGPGIRLLEEWYYLEQPEPRLAAARWMRHFPFLARSSGIFHYRLGEE